jgi:hypothetical protein
MTPGRVPFEYIGLARRLWQRVEAEQRTVKPAQDCLVSSLEALSPRRGFRQPPLRPTLRQFAARWRALPSTALLGLKLVETGDRLSLAEIRVLPSRMRMEGWVEPELALGVRLTQIEFARRRVSIKRIPLGDACLHALARRYERGPDRDDATVLADLFALAEAYEQALTPGDFRIPASGGAWVGERVKYQDRPFLAARTYVENAERQHAAA